MLQNTYCVTFEKKGEKQMFTLDSAKQALKKSGTIFKEIIDKEKPGYVVLEFPKKKNPIESVHLIFNSALDRVYKNPKRGKEVSSSAITFIKNERGEKCLSGELSTKHFTHRGNNITQIEERPSQFRLHKSDTTFKVGDMGKRRIMVQKCTHDGVPYTITRTKEFPLVDKPSVDGWASCSLSVGEKPIAHTLEISGNGETIKYNILARNKARKVIRHNLMRDLRTQIKQTVPSSAFKI